VLLVEMRGKQWELKEEEKKRLTDIVARNKNQKPFFVNQITKEGPGGLEPGRKGWSKTSVALHKGQRK